MTSPWRSEKRAGRQKLRDETSIDIWAGSGGFHEPGSTGLHSAICHPGSLKARHSAIFVKRNLPLVSHQYLFPSPRSCSWCPSWLVGEDQGKEDAVDDLDQRLLGYGCPAHDQVVAHEIDRQ